MQAQQQAAQQQVQLLANVAAAQTELKQQLQLQAQRAAEERRAQSGCCTVV
jgi:hypothetical protein